MKSIRIHKKVSSEIEKLDFSLEGQLTSISLFLAIKDIDHTRTKTRPPQTNGIVERFHRTILDEFYRVPFRKKIYSTLESLQQDLDDYLREYNFDRTHQRRFNWRRILKYLIFSYFPIFDFLSLEFSCQETLSLNTGLAYC